MNTEIYIGKNKVNIGVDETEIANQHSVTSTYSKGDMVMHDGHMYVATESVTAGEWDSTKWIQCNVASMISTKANQPIIVTELPANPVNGQLYAILED